MRQKCAGVGQFHQRLRPLLQCRHQRPDAVHGIGPESQRVATSEPSHNFPGQPAIVAQPQPMRVDVLQLGIVHPRRAAPDAIQVEQSNGFIAVQDLDIAMRPAEPQQVVAQRLGQIALFLELQHADRAMALGQFLAILAVDQRDMGEVRPLPAHRVIDLRLAERIGQVVVAADDMGDRHVVVVHHHGVLVGRRAVAAQDDHVVQLGVADAHRALDQIFNHRLALAWRAQADGRRHAGGRLGGVAVAPG